MPGNANRSSPCDQACPHYTLAMSQNVNSQRRLWPFGRSTNVLFVIATAILVAAPTLRAGDISGHYSDKGVVVSTAADVSTPQTISFHGLLGQEFDPQLAALDFDQTDRFTLEDDGETLVTEIFNADNQRLLRLVWDARRGFDHQDGKAVVRMRVGESKTERCVLVMEPADDHQSLLVKVYHVMPSTFGPQSEPVGTYLFVRAS